MQELKQTSGTHCLLTAAGSGHDGGLHLLACGSEDDAPSADPPSSPFAI